MHKRFILFTLVVFFIPLLLGQQTFAQPTFAWAKGMGGISIDNGNSVAVDASGNVYTTGRFYDTADFDPGPNVATLISKGNSDIFISKLDVNGNYVWAKSIGGIGPDWGYGIAVDGTGNIYVMGIFRDTMDADPGSGTSNIFSGNSSGNGIFILKLDFNGNYVWGKSIEINGTGAGGSSQHAMALDASGNIYITGGFSSTMDFDPGPATAYISTAGSSDIYIAKYDANGNYIWAHGIGGSSQDYGNSIALDASGNIYVAGGVLTSGAVDFNPDTAIVNSFTGGVGLLGFVLKLNNNGNYQWAFRGISQVSYLTVDASSGSVYVTGSFSGTLDFDPSATVASLSSSGGTDIYIAKYGGANGNYIWAKNMGGSGADVGNAVTIDTSGNIYITGQFSGTAADFDPGPNAANLASKGGTDVFISKLDTNGNYVWAGSMGGAAADLGNDIIVDARQNIYVTGNTSSTAGGDFNPDPTDSFMLYSNGNADIFVVKLSQGPPCTNTSSTLTESACYSYTLNGQTYTATGSYTQTLPNSTGCDSIITLNLTIRNNSSTQQRTVCDSFVFKGKALTASGTYVDTFTNAANCDSIVTLNLTIRGISYHTTVSETVCDSFVFLGKKHTQSGIYTDTFTSAGGCDSIITLNLVIQGSSSSTTINATACDNYVLNDSVYTISGTYTQVLPNAVGCDSIITLHLIVNSTPHATAALTGTILTAGSADAWQWVDCDNSFAAIPGATMQLFTPTVSGNYAVVATATNGCSDTSECINVKLETHIQELGTGNRIQLYPNPTNGRITIKAERPLNNVTISLVNVVGQVLYHKGAQYGTVFILDMALYPSGIYFVEIGEGEHKVKMKVVKE